MFVVDNTLFDEKKQDCVYTPVDCPTIWEVAEPTRPPTPLTYDPLHAGSVREGSSSSVVGMRGVAVFDPVLIASNSSAEPEPHLNELEVPVKVTSTSATSSTPSMPVVPAVRIRKRKYGKTTKGATTTAISA